MSELNAFPELQIEFMDDDFLLDDEEVFRSFCGRCDDFSVSSLSCSVTAAESESAAVPEENTSGDDGNCPPKKKRKQRSTIKKTQNVIKPGDARLLYATIFADAFNRCERELLEEILQKYCEEDCHLYYKFIGAENPFGPNYAEVHGISAVCMFWDTLFTSIPDAVFNVVESRLLVHPSSMESTVVSNFTFIGTKLFEIETMDDNIGGRIVLKSAKSKVEMKSTSSVATDTDVSVTCSIIVNALATSEHIGKRIENKSKKIKKLADNIPKQHIDLVEQEVKTSIDRQNAYDGKLHSDRYELMLPPQSSKPLGLGRAFRSGAPVKLIGSTVYHVNAQKKIYKIEFIYTLLELAHAVAGVVVDKQGQQKENN